MRNLLALAAILLIAFAIIGHYRGWYTFTKADGQIDVTIDTKKTVDDIKRGDVLPPKESR